MENADKENQQNKNEANKEVDLEKLLKQNLAVSQEVLSISKYIKRYIFWKRIIGLIQLFIILIPIILGVIYLPPIIEDGLKTINNNLNNSASGIISSNY
jgi:hypothetical protein